MKKFIRNTIIALMFITGLILALPFSPLRKSLNSTMNNLTEKSYLGLGLNNIKNKQIAQAIGESLQINLPNGTNNLNSISSKKYYMTSAYESRTGNITSVTYTLIPTNAASNINGSLVAGNSRNGAGNNAGNGANYTNPTAFLSYGNSSAIANNPNGYMAANSDLNNSEKGTSVKQSAKNGNPPPGGGNDLPPSLPISDGISFSLLLAALFLGVKLRKNYAL